MNGDLPLAVDIGDLFGLLIFVLFLIVSVVGHLTNKWRQVQQEAARRARPRPNMPPRQGPLEEEIAEFLRKGGSRRQAEGPPAAASRRPTPPRPQNLPPRPPLERPLDIKPLEVEAEPGHLREALARRQISGPLESEVAQADDRMQDHLSEKFGHRLRSLAPKGAAETAAPPPSPPAQATPIPLTAVAGLAAMLASSSDLRQAIVLSEILNRPVHRWE